MSVLELALRERIRRDYSAEGMEEIFLRLDLLHDYASRGQAGDITPLSVFVNRNVDHLIIEMLTTVVDERSV